MTPTLESFGGWRATLAQLASHSELAPEHAAAAVAEILSGSATDGQIGGFLVGLATRGVTGAELAAMVDVMLAHATPLHLPDTGATVDIVGTGGSPLRQDRAFNVSTAACFVVAGAGVPVCKHGNRKASSSSGSTDVLEALGITVELDGPAVVRCVAEAGLGFAFARAFHPAMRFAGPVRAELGIPTVFNLLGPLSHPGRVTRQVIGVADPAVAPMVAEVLARRGAPRAMVVHGSDGLDELTLAGPSQIWEVVRGEVTQWTLDPSDLGLETVDVESLGAGSPEANAEAVRGLLGAVADSQLARGRRNLVCLNAAAALVVAGAAGDLAEGLVMAGASIDSGEAEACLNRLIEVSRLRGITGQGSS